MGSTHRGDSDVKDVEVAQDTSAVATLAVEAIKGKCPPHGPEVAVVYNFRIAWVRNALDILGIAVSDRRDSGVCKAALAQYYQDLNASRTEANQAQGGTEGACSLWHRPLLRLALFPWGPLVVSGTAPFRVLPFFL